MERRREQLRDRRKVISYLGIILVLLPLAVLYLLMGPTGSLAQGWNALLSLLGLPAGDYPQLLPSILAYRALRLGIAVVVGFTLSFSGAALQNMLQNPLADPYVLGVSAGAGFGATLASYLQLGKGFWGVSAVSVFAFLGAMGAVTIVYSLARRRGNTSTGSLIIGGIIVSSFLSAGIIFLLALAPLRDQHQVLLWLLGDISNPSISFPHLLAIFLVSLLGFFALLFLGRELDILSLGEEEALNLGVDVGKVRMAIFIIVSLSCAMVVAVSGLIGFVGIVVPHAARRLVGSGARRLLPLSALMGAVIILSADGVSRLLLERLAIPIVPVGVITAFIGAPYFLFIYFRRMRG